jgi:hypothetical protein
MDDRVMQAVMRPADPTRSIGDDVAAALRRISLVVIASAVAGVLVGGVGSRVVMRIAALAAPEARGLLTENGNVVGELTLAGTIGLLVFAGIASAVAGAGVFVVTDPWLPRRTFARGLALGGVLLALFGSAIVDPGNADFVLLGDRALNVAMFSALFFAFGLVASGVLTVLDHRVPPAATFSPRAWALALVIALPAVLGVLGLAFGMDPRLGVPLVGARGTIAVAHLLDRRGSLGTAQIVRVAATATLIAVLLIAGSTYVDAVVTIL